MYEKLTVCQPTLVSPTFLYSKRQPVPK